MGRGPGGKKRERNEKNTVWSPTFLKLIKKSNDLFI